jgi:hypothetical protein
MPAAGLIRSVSPARPITMELNISLSPGEKTNLTPATSTEITIKAAHILLNAMRLTIYFPTLTEPAF